MMVSWISGRYVVFIDTVFRKSQYFVCPASCQCILPLSAEEEGSKEAPGEKGVLDLVVRSSAYVISSYLPSST